MTNRITPQMIEEAKQATGFKLVWGTPSFLCARHLNMGCPLDLLLLQKGPGNPQPELGCREVDQRLELPLGYSFGFVTGFDGRSEEEVTVMPGERAGFDQGYPDGQACSEYFQAERWELKQYRK